MRPFRWPGDPLICTLARWNSWSLSSGKTAFRCDPAWRARRTCCFAVTVSWPPGVCHSSAYRWKSRSLCYLWVEVPCSPALERFKISFAEVLSVHFLSVFTFIIFISSFWSTLSVRTGLNFRKFLILAWICFPIFELRRSRLTGKLAYHSSRAIVLSRFSF